MLSHWWTHWLSHWLSHRRLHGRIGTHWLLHGQLLLHSHRLWRHPHWLLWDPHWMLWHSHWLLHFLHLLHLLLLLLLLNHSHNFWRNLRRTFSLFWLFLNHRRLIFLLKAASLFAVATPNTNSYTNDNWNKYKEK